MNPKEIIAGYVEAMQARVMLEASIDRFLLSLGSHGSISLEKSPVKLAYTKLVKQLTPPELYDWCEWWMWECDFGTKNNMLTIDGKPYQVNQLTLQEFLDLI